MPITVLEETFSGKQYGYFKTATADVILDMLTSLQTRYFSLRTDKTLNKILLDGAEKARAQASITLDKVYEVIGLISKY